MKKDKVVCNCYNVTVGEMEEAVAKNATSFEEIQDETNVSLCCGAWKINIMRKLINIIRIKMRF